MAEMKRDYFGNEEINTHLREAIGNKAMLQELLKRIQSTTLSPCPFCGNKAVVTMSTVYYLFGLKIECKNCRCSTGVYTNGFNLLTRKQETALDCLSNAYQKWESRTKTATY